MLRASNSLKPLVTIEEEKPLDMAKVEPRFLGIRYCGVNDRARDKSLFNGVERMPLPLGCGVAGFASVAFMRDVPDLVECSMGCLMVLFSACSVNHWLRASDVSWYSYRMALCFMQGMTFFLIAHLLWMASACYLR